MGAGGTPPATAPGGIDAKCLRDLADVPVAAG
jgi:hypothetical protein